MISHTTNSNVLDDLGFSPEEAKNLKIRATLMRSLEKYINKNTNNQTHAAQLLGVSQPRISDLINGKINHFSIDQLVIMHEHVGINVALVIDDRLVA